MSKVTDYGIRHGLEPDMLEVFETVIYRLDVAYMQDQHQKQKLEVARAEREAKRNSGKTKIR